LVFVIEVQAVCVTFGRRRVLVSLFAFTSKTGRPLKYGGRGCGFAMHLINLPGSERLAEMAGLCAAGHFEHAAAPRARSSIRGDG